MSEPIHQSKFEVYGEEMLEKKVKKSGNSGRVYLPPSWILLGLEHVLKLFEWTKLVQRTDHIIFFLF
jgi:hypothetical protein